MITDLVKRNKLRQANGLKPVKAIWALPTLKEIFASQWCPRFEYLMRNRLCMGYFRYAPLSKQKKGQMDNIGSIEKRVKKYKETGNDELLVDIANICMVEFLLGAHPNKHFASEDDGEHVQEN